MMASGWRADFSAATAALTDAGSTCGAGGASTRGG